MARRAFKAYIFDLDGVIYRGEELQPEAAETIETLRSDARSVYFLTNNSTQSRAQYADKLDRLGIPTEPCEIMTSAYAAALYLKNERPHNCHVYVVGESGLKDEITSAGSHIVMGGNRRPVDFVVVGLDRRFSYRRLFVAQQAIMGGARFVATNMDPTFPLEGGLLYPGGGAIVSAIETASGVKPLLIGKPETYTLEMVMSLADVKPEDTVIVGDRLDTDVLAGKKAGVYTVLILTGVTTKREALEASDEMKPDWIIRSLGELIS